MPFPRLSSALNVDVDSCDHRATVEGEVGNQAVYLPGILPKFPGRFYYHFGKPIETEGK